MQEMIVAGVKVELPLHAPVLLLHEPASDRYLPIWIGAAEASAIVWGLEPGEADRPMTHDLLLDALAAAGESVAAVEIVSVDVADGVFAAELVLSGGARVDARPSDAVAVAVRAGAPVRCAEQVLDAAAVTLGPRRRPSDSEIKRFREFLENVSADDFGH